MASIGIQYFFLGGGFPAIEPLDIDPIQYTRRDVAGVHLLGGKQGYNSPVASVLIDALILVLTAAIFHVSNRPIKYRYSEVTDMASLCSFQNS